MCSQMKLNRFSIQRIMSELLKRKTLIVYPGRMFSNQLNKPRSAHVLESESDIMITLRK